MAITALYVDGSAGADTNGGSSEGAAIVSGASADTDGTTTVSLADDTPDLSGVSVGDSIFLAAETSGGQGNDSEVFEITAVDDGADTVTVTPTPGTNANQSWAIGGAFATIDHAMNVVAAGDHVNVKASATYAELATIVTAGTATAPIVFTGYTASVGDGGQASIGGATGAHGITSSVASGQHYAFYNIRITDCSSDGWQLNTRNHLAFINCRADQCTNGFIAEDFCKFLACEADNNSAKGISWDTDCCMYGCVSHTNGDSPFDFNKGVIVNCLAYGLGAGDYGFEASNSTFYWIIGNTVDGEGAATTRGFSIGSGGTPQMQMFIGNIAYDCATGAHHNRDFKEDLVSAYNLVNSNTANYSGMETFVGEQTGAPAFTDEAGNDYRPGSGSAAKANGVDAGFAMDGSSFIDIGAVQREEPAGGSGGLLMPNKRAGKQ